MDKHSSKLSTMEFMFIVGNKHCMIIHHIQLLHKSSAENSFFLPKYHMRDCDEKGESNAAKALFVFFRGFEKVARSSVERKWFV